MSQSIHSFSLFIFIHFFHSLRKRTAWVEREAKNWRRNEMNYVQKTMKFNSARETNSTHVGMSEREGINWNRAAAAREIQQRKKELIELIEWWALAGNCVSFIIIHFSSCRYLFIQFNLLSLAGVSRALQ